MQILDIIPGSTKWLFLIAVLAFYAIGWVAWRVQNDCIQRGYGPVATTFWSVGTLFCFFPCFPLYVLLRSRMGVKTGALIEEAQTGTAVTLLCMKCGQDTPADLQSCVHCGQPVASGEDTPRVGTVACLVCGTQNPVGSQTCATCGQWL